VRQEVVTGHRPELSPAARRVSGQNPLEVTVCLLGFAEEVVDEAEPKMGEGLEGIVAAARRHVEHLLRDSQDFLELAARNRMVCF